MQYRDIVVGLPLGPQGKMFVALTHVMLKTSGAGQAPALVVGGSTCGAHMGECLNAGQSCLCGVSLCT